MKTTAAVLLLAASAQAFTAPQAGRSASALNMAGPDPLNNAYAIGGKNSWEFEQDAMYVEEPKKAPVKKAVKKTVAAKAKATQKFAAQAKKAVTEEKKGFKLPFFN